MEILANFVDNDEIYKKITNINRSMHMFKLKWLYTVLGKVEILRYI